LLKPYTLLLTLILVVPVSTTAQDQMPPALVKVGLAEYQTLAPVRQVPGTVASRNDARLAAEVEGRLISVADIGMEVSRGDALARIEDTMLRLRHDELEAEITRARARLKYLENEESRFTKLAESNLAAATQLDQTRSDRDVARSELQVAQSRLAQNDHQLARTTIRAPFDGVVVERLMTPGERVDEGGDVVRLVDQQDLEVITRAPLEYYPFVTQGMELELRSRNKVSSGIVRTVVAVGDENTHQFEIRVDLVGAEYTVGQTLRVSVPMSEVRQVLSVPRDALVLRPEGITVFIVDTDNKTRQVKVTTGIGSGDKIEINGDVSAGDRVIVRGNERIKPGQAVSISSD
jgi:RND family efflux transporter MFP subunit